ncbi:thiamine pyrophosphate-binding protein [Chloroflexota bacterium]
MSELCGDDLIGRTLKQLGVKHVYSVPGGPIQEVLRACVKEGIRAIGVRNEQSGVMMAAAENYVAGGVAGVPILVSGPGSTNAVTGVLVAKDNCWPLVVIGGRQSLNLNGKGQFEELETVPIFQSITKWSTLLYNVARIPEYLSQAFLVATSGQPGPVFLELPREVIIGTVAEEKVKQVEKRRLDLQPGAFDSVRQAIELLLKAERPLMLLGKGVRWSEPYAELRKLVETLKMPFVASPMGRGGIPDDHPLNVNAARSFALRNADVVLMAGVRLNWLFRFGNELAKTAKIIQIDIEPREIDHNRAATVGIVGDIKQVLCQMLDELDGKAAASAGRAEKSAWLTDLRTKEEENKQSLIPFTNSDAVPMTTHRMVKEIAEFIPRDAICVVDGQLVLAAGRQVLPSYYPASRLNSGSNGCIGIGVPFAIGAKLAQPERLVISICGDCSFGFSAMEMETAIRYNLPIIFVVEENGGITGHKSQDRIYGKEYSEPVSNYTPDIHYELIMQAFGGHAEYVQQPEELKPALQRAVASGKAACICVKVDPRTPFPGPMGRPKQGGIYSLLDIDRSIE